MLLNHAAGEGWLSDWRTANREVLQTNLCGPARARPPVNCTIRSTGISLGAAAALGGAYPGRNTCACECVGGVGVYTTCIFLSRHVSLNFPARYLLISRTDQA